MPRNSPYRIVLTNEEERRLEEITRRYTSPYCDVVRAESVLLAARGLENKEIGEHLRVPRQIVSKWRKRFFYERLPGLEDRPGRGRRPSFSPSGRRGN